MKRSHIADFVSEALETRPMDVLTQRLETIRMLTALESRLTHLETLGEDDLGKIEVMVLGNDFHFGIGTEPPEHQEPPSTRWNKSRQMVYRLGEGVVSHGME